MVILTEVGNSEKLPILFSKKLKANNYFFLVGKFRFLENIWGNIRTKKFFSLERKIFFSPFLKFSLSIKFVFSRQFFPQKIVIFFKIYENQQLFFRELLT